jgi:hypothetical protein
VWFRTIELLFRHCSCALTNHRFVVLACQPKLAKRAKVGADDQD